LSGNGDVTRAKATLLEYQTVIAASPGPWTSTWPSSPTVATPESLVPNFTQRVTSRAAPSEK
jgi:hypothetical protein